VAEDRPDPQRVARAIREARASDKGRVLKVLFLDDKGNSVGEWASSQVPESPWTGVQMGGLQEPPYRFEQLTYLAEMHPVHSSAIEQKTVDIAGKGWTWDPRDDSADDGVRTELEDWFQGLSPDDEDMTELIYQLDRDVNTLGWGLAEIVRDPNGVAQRLYHVPAHTVRAHRDGYRLCQLRDARKVWFKRWGAPQRNGKDVMVDAATGNLTVSKEPTNPANDLFVIRTASRRSSWYGIPDYISGIGWITLALAARDDNLMFFNNRREPRWAIILTNLQDSPGLQEDLRRAFTVDLRQPYRNLLIPITGPGKIEFQKLTDNRMEGSFDRLSERADKAIMIAHRVPGERLANTEVGALGGNVASQANRVYKEGVVAPAQELLNARLNRFIEIEWARTTGKERERLPWRLCMDDLDLGTDREETDLAVIRFHGNLVTLREARAAIGLEPLMLPAGSPHPVTGQPIGEDEDVEDPKNDQLFTELPGAQGQAGQPGRVPPGTGGLNIDPVSQGRELALAALGKDVRDLWRQARENDELLRQALERDVREPEPRGE
jgi:PBSX family phage portal protein